MDWMGPWYDAIEYNATINVSSVVYVGGQIVSCAELQRDHHQLTMHGRNIAESFVRVVVSECRSCIMGGVAACIGALSMDRFEPLMAILKDDDDGGGVASSAQHATNDKSAAGHFPVSVSQSVELKCGALARISPSKRTTNGDRDHFKCSATQRDARQPRHTNKELLLSILAECSFARITIYKLTVRPTRPVQCRQLPELEESIPVNYH